MKKLTNYGIKEEDLDVESRNPYEDPNALTPQQIPQREKRQAIENFNNNPRTQQYNAELVDKPTREKEKQSLLFWKILAIIAILLFAINLVWNNTNVSLNKYKSNSTFISNIDTPDINPIFNNNATTNTNNNFTIINNNNITLDINLDKNISKEIADDIMNQLNLSLFNLTNGSG